MGKTPSDRETRTKSVTKARSTIDHGKETLEADHPIHDQPTNSTEPSPGSQVSTSSSPAAKFLSARNPLGIVNTHAFLVQTGTFEYTISTTIGGVPTEYVTSLQEIYTLRRISLPDPSGYTRPEPYTNLNQIDEPYIDSTPSSLTALITTPPLLLSLNQTPVAAIVLPLPTTTTSDINPASGNNTTLKSNFPPELVCRPNLDYACNQDNPLRTLLRFAALASTFCPTFLNSLCDLSGPEGGPVGPAPTLPEYMIPFATPDVYSACSCFESNYAATKSLSAIITASTNPVTTNFVVVGGFAPSTLMTAAVPSSAKSVSAADATQTSKPGVLTVETGAATARDKGMDSSKLVPLFVIVPLAVITGVMMLIWAYKRRMNND